MFIKFGLQVSASPLETKMAWTFLRTYLRGRSRKLEPLTSYKNTTTPHGVVHSILMLGDTFRDSSSLLYATIPNRFPTSFR